MSDSADSHRRRRDNHLIDETSPYLLQHAHNPVDWHPWGPEALEKARKEDKPIFLSVGYAACHWCHVMEHESFEDEQIADVLNEHFVPIKVDREERPDLDQIYMNAVQMMTGRGGWPMSVFLTPDLHPFYGGTYYPQRDRGGMPGFERVLGAVAEAWQQKRDEIVGQAGQITERIRAVGAGMREQGALDSALLDAAFHELDRSFDEAHGGFGAAPKFPHAMDLRFLLRYWFRTGSTRALQMVQTTLDHMAAGGIYDHLAGGFHRYSTDARWLVPHFEKMLYDNALLTLSYLEAFQATGLPRYARVARETLDYVLDQMTDPGGAFYSTEDADSEGEEGRFYVWTKQQVDEVLGDELARVFCYCYDVTEFGNWENNTILNKPKTLAQAAKLLEVEQPKLEEQLAEARAKLLEVRAGRVRPGRDEKILTDWNGLMIEAFALGGRVLDEPRYLAAAQSAAEFVLDNLRDEQGRLLHCYKDGRARFPAYADDHAFLANALVTLYETTFDPRWFRAACELAELLLDRFWDDTDGGLFFTAKDHEKLIARNKIAFDNATPSANSIAAHAWLRVAKLTGEDRWRERAEQTLNAFRAVMSRAPTGAAQLLIALDFYLSPVKELALLGSSQEDIENLAQAVYHRFLPNKVIAAADGESDALSLLAGKKTRDGRPTLYVCENFTCAAPVAGTDEAAAALDQLLPEHVRERSIQPT